jgi:hypothetical protein
MSEEVVEVFDIVAVEDDAASTKSSSPDGTDLENEGEATCVRATQRVSTLSERSRVRRWMVDEEKKAGTKGLLAKTVRRFHSIFRAHDDRTRKAAMMRVSRWWKSKLDDGPKNKILTRRNRDGRKQVHAKALWGRGRKRADWVIALYSDLYDEFHKLQRLGVKMSASVLKQVAHQLLKEANNDTIYGLGLLDPVSKKCMNILVNSS